MKIKSIYPGARVYLDGVELSVSDDVNPSTDGLRIENAPAWPQKAVEYEPGVIGDGRIGGDGVPGMVIG